MKNIALLGSTGSIGRQALDVIRRMPSSFRVKALSARSNLALLREQIREFRPELAAVQDEQSARELASWCKGLRLRTAVVHGPEGLETAAGHPGADLVLSAVVGAAGLKPLVAAIRSGKTVALANKEALVVAGDFLMAEARRKGVDIIPVDSEHSAIFQCLKNEKAGTVSRILLTASGGPFYRSKKELSRITVDDALAHPTWDMGPKITIDSATLMNKGLEAIEAHHLFGVPLERIEIVIHPQSIVHSLVEFADRSVLAQLSVPDMRLPIQYALTFPSRMPSPLKALDLVKAGRLEFGRPDFRRFRCLKLALEAGAEGGTMPAVMNAANETAVHAFLRREIGFAAIPAVIEKVMSAHTPMRKPGLEEIIKADTSAREAATRLISNFSRGRRGW